MNVYNGWYFHVWEIRRQFAKKSDFGWFLTYIIGRITENECLVQMSYAATPILS